MQIYILILCMNDYALLLATDPRVPTYHNDWCVVKCQPTAKLEVQIRVWNIKRPIKKFTEQHLSVLKTRHSIKCWRTPIVTLKIIIQPDIWL